MLLKENKFQRARPSPPFSKIDRHACFIVKDRNCLDEAGGATPGFSV